MDNHCLLNYMSNKYSQAGQDGIIEHVFKILGKKNGHFVEFGAWDGKFLSNCRKLFEEGWSGVFIEADKKKFSDLLVNYYGQKHITCIHRFVESKGINCFDNIMKACAPEKPIDFLSIDVDSMDLEIFETIERFLPVVACLEGGKGAHPYDPRMPVYCITQVGQSLSVINKIAIKKGYRILCSFQDTFLIKREYFDLFNVTLNLTQLYLDGYKVQEYTHIPMYALRLAELFRKNRILNYVLTETKRKEYKTDDEWQRQERGHINEVLSSIPESLLTSKMNGFEQIFSIIMCFFKFLLKKYIKIINELIFQ